MLVETEAIKAGYGGFGGFALMLEYLDFEGKVAGSMRRVVLAIAKV